MLETCPRSAYPRIQNFKAQQLGRGHADICNKILLETLPCPQNEWLKDSVGRLGTEASFDGSNSMIPRTLRTHHFCVSLNYLRIVE